MSALSILIAEDDADDRLLIQKALEESDKGFKIDFVANGVELIEHLYKIKNEKQGKKYPRFILLDLNMPKMDGREVLKNIKKLIHKHKIIKKNVQYMIKHIIIIIKIKLRKDIKFMKNIIEIQI